MIIVITGPTGVGKTKLSIELAKKYNAEIINADSVQVYKDIDIASAKVKEEEKEGIVHHLLDIVPYDYDYSVYDYQKDGRKILDKLLSQNKNVIIVGGTGLYIKALLYDYRFITEEEVEDISLDNRELRLLVKEMDPDTTVDMSNRRRLIREYINLKNGADNKLGDNLLYDNVFFIGLTTDRDILYKRIDDRVDIMVKDGLIEEAKKFYKLNHDVKSLKTVIGYKELFEYFDGNMSLEESLDLIKKRSRNYAKRQYTFFNNKMNIKWFNVNFNNFSETINEVEEYIKNNS